MTEHKVCLLLGSNIDREKNIPLAISTLREQLTVLSLSSVWESASSSCCYPDYLNMAVLVTTTLDADALKHMVLRPLEARMGRVRTEDKNASRPIDIDIIVFDDVVVDPTLWQHVHRAIPVSEILPRLRSAEGKPLIEVAGSLAASTSIYKRKDISASLT
jgi:2-amino-4-hydroxy-6-hydroxymethyldihydropteridine diphosphokinase